MCMMCNGGGQKNETGCDISKSWNIANASGCNCMCQMGTALAVAGENTI